MSRDQDTGEKTVNEPIKPRPQGDDRTVTVCDQCLRASCWKGLFMCDENRTAGTVDKTVAELRELDREHSDRWSAEAYERMSGGRSSHG